MTTTTTRETANENQRRATGGLGPFRRHGLAFPTPTPGPLDISRL